MKLTLETITKKITLAMLLVAGVTAFLAALNGCGKSTDSEPSAPTQGATTFYGAGQ